MRDPAPPAPRKRNAAATRDAILLSARRAFSQAGYEQVGVREIAAGAGVTAMMINRYFGSKQELYAAVCASSMADPVILTPQTLSSPDRAALMARKLVEITRSDRPPLDGFPLMYQAGSRKAAEIGRGEVERGHFNTLLNALSGELAAERAGLALALVAGVQVMRQMMVLSALANAADEDLIRILTPMFRSLLDGD